MIKPQTSNLIAALRAQHRPVPTMAMGVQVFLGILLLTGGGILAALWHLGVRADLTTRIMQPAFLATLGTLNLALFGWGWAALRLWAPRWPLGWDTILALSLGGLGWLGLALPFMWELTPREIHATMMDPITHACALVTTILALPLTGSVLFMLRRARPTTPRLMMLSAVATGATGSMLTLTLHCAKNDAAHLVVGHLLPAFMLGIIAIIIGRRWLRW